MILIKSIIKKSVLVFGVLFLTSLSAGASICDSDPQEGAEPFQAIYELGEVKYFVVCTPAQLRAIDKSDEWLKSNFILGQDIDLSQDIKENGYFKIGKDQLLSESARFFTGRFNGQDFTISGFTYIGEGEYFVGLFGASRLAYIHNLTLSSFNLKGKNFVGGLVAKAYSSRIENIKVVNSFARGHRDTGLIVGSHKTIPEEENAQVQEDFPTPGIFNSLAIGYIHCEVTHCGGLAGSSYERVQGNASLIYIFGDRANRGYLVGYEMGSMLNNQYRPLTAVGEVFDGPQVLEYSYWEGNILSLEPTLPCGNYYLNKKNDCNFRGSPEAFTYLNLEIAQELVDLYPVAFEKVDPRVGSELGLLEGAKIQIKECIVDTDKANDCATRSADEIKGWVKGSSEWLKEKSHQILQLLN